MDLKRLNHLVCLADQRNFGRAAVLCHLTQSAFSRSIQAAEEELGLQLFDRGTLEAGKRADLIVLDANPLDAIRNLQTVRLVMKGGTLYRSADIWKALGFTPPR